MSGVIATQARNRQGRAEHRQTFMAACATFISNVVIRFHEYADARLHSELTVVEHRRRVLARRAGTTSVAEPRPLLHRPVHGK